MSFVFNENKFSELNEKYKEMISQNHSWEKIAMRRNKGHVYGVQTFANKMGYSFVEHDADKFTSLYIPYILITIEYNPDFKKDIEEKKKLNPDMDSFMRGASFTHVTRNEHHPEFGDKDTAEVIEKDKESSAVIDGTKMSNEAIIEMCCDWSSVGAEKGNSPQSGFKLKKNKWKFSEQQQKLIGDTLEKLWPGGNDETAEIKHEERYFNDNLWKHLNEIWDGYSKSSQLKEEFSFGDFENTVRNLAKERESINNIVGKFSSSNYEPSVTLQGVGSLQSLSFLFSPAITNYLINIFDSVINNNYAELANSRVLKAMNLDKIELGNQYNTKSVVTNNFINGIKRSIEAVNSSKLNNKLLLFSKFLNNLKNHARSITNKLEKEEYLKDADALIKVLGIVKNIITNRNSFINVLNKTLLLRESEEEIVSERFMNIYEGI